MLKAIVRKVLPVSTRRFLRSCLQSHTATVASEGYEIIQGDFAESLLAGWQDPAVATRQHQAFIPLLKQMRNGRPRQDFVALAQAVTATKEQDPSVIEVGCGSGWNAEVLAHLLRRPVRYIGVDYSPAMIALGRRAHANVSFIVGDAMRLPLRDHCCDILISGTVLMHLVDYQRAIEESRRVARAWCIFHTVPVVRQRATTRLRKLAYGQPVVEVIFNEAELRDRFATAGLAVRQTIPSLRYDLQAVLGEPTVTQTFVCEVQ
jgi:SAM-dependent methyltransferase